MDAGTLLVIIALVLTVVSFFRTEYPLLTVAVLLACVALLVGVEPLNLD